MLPDAHLIDIAASAYVELLAAGAGCTVARHDRDYGIDGTARRIRRLPSGAFVPSAAAVEFQLKATTRWRIDDGHIVYDVPVRAYHLIQSRGGAMTPLYLFLVCFPPEPADWMRFDDRGAAIQAQAYWWRQPSARSPNMRSVRIRVPTSNALTPAAFAAIFTAEDQRVGS